MVRPAARGRRYSDRGDFMLPFVLEIVVNFALVLAFPIVLVVLLISVNRWGRENDRMGGRGIDRYVPGYPERMRHSTED